MYFGDVIDGEMVLSEIGHSAAGSWLAMSRVYDVLIRDAWVIMPNHVHLLFGINNLDGQKYQTNSFKKMIKNSVSSIINHYKGRVTKYAKKENIPFSWQSRFFDHIVRTEKEFFKIQNYIETNPIKWKEDRFCRQNSF
jgi:REP element-mobilizing transposase RayT